MLGGGGGGGNDRFRDLRPLSKLLQNLLGKKNYGNLQNLLSYLYTLSRSIFTSSPNFKYFGAEV